ncbi:regulator of chromosome condensation 1/beta-lactamase-inhibitor protein II [Mycotypha africana]|uniref:regulator of chromosome condensation 1/beta-lactamase-inhibitor protein II n=1 Tax=Mycotypha africana TaxID=64632 RepID=UPI00230120F4|nr:regulator of chromosome condensation 1/beta-lactamase-inhibitor protein II [Mycotypha africana]KAI8977033.1 regulator of chromosome condensation 1/beta-lactamase-inhibitor protein II [Mycotypha africana]
MLDTLPSDILLYDIILPFLDGESIIHLSLVSRFFYALTNDEFIWKKLCIEDFNISQDNAYRFEGWKKFYKALRYHVKVFTWGENFDGRLGLDEPPRMISRRPNRVTVPQELVALRNKCIIDIASGGWSFHALDTAGSVWTWGTMQQDITVRQSIGTRRLRTPTLLQSDNNGVQPKVQFRSISSGRGHVIGLAAKDNSVWHWSNHVLLQKVELLSFDSQHDKIVQVVANWNYSSVLTEKGDVYIVPKPDYVIPSEMDREPATTVVAHPGVSIAQLFEHAHADRYDKDKIVQIAGLDGYTLALTRFGRVLKLATGDVDRFTAVPSQHVIELEKYSSLENEHNDRHRIMQRFITGAFMNFAVYTKDKVLLGNTDAHSSTEPIQMPELNHRGVCKVSFGDYHYGALTNEGQVLTWGSFSSGALGLGNISHQHQSTPHIVEALKNQFAFAIGFGGWQSSVLAIEMNDDRPMSSHSEQIENEKEMDNSSMFIKK